MTRQHAKSFYFSSFALPQEKKNAAYAIYAFCRYADDLVDEAVSEDGVEAALLALRNELDRMLDGECTTPEFVPAFAWAVKKYGIERELFIDLLRGMKTDVGPVRLHTWPELREYCYFVASVVGLMMARILELRDPRGRDHAIDLGIAMQLTNIARDVGEDLQRDRVYLPSSELQAHGVQEADLLAGRVSPEFVSLMKFQIHRARMHFQRGENGIALLADDGSQFTVWLMREVYAGILDEIENAGYDVLNRRVSTGRFTKLRLALRAWKRYHRSKRCP